MQATQILTERTPGDPWPSRFTGYVFIHAHYPSPHWIDFESVRSTAEECESSAFEADDKPPGRICRFECELVTVKEIGLDEIEKPEQREF